MGKAANYLYTEFAFARRLALAVVLVFSGTALAQSVEPLPTLDEVVAKLLRFDVVGRVVDAQDRPVADCQVALYFDSGEPGLRDRVLAQAVSDAAGEFRFAQAGVWEPVIPGGYREKVSRLIVVASHPQRGLQYAVLLKDDKMAAVTLRLEPAKSCEVKVFDAADRPVAGARVWLSVLRRPRSADRVADANRDNVEFRRPIDFLRGSSDGAGRIMLPGLAGDTWFYADKEGYTRGCGTEKISLFSAKPVRGVVRREDGTPLAGAAVWLDYVSGGMHHTDQQLTGPDGRYVFSVPVYGFDPPAADKPQVVQGQLQFRPQDTRPGSLLVGRRRTVELNADTPLEQDLNVERGCILAGTVVDMATGKPVPKFSFTRDQPIEGSNYLDVDRVQADERGQFRTSVPRGTEVRLSLQNASVPGYAVDTEWLNRGNILGFSSSKLEADQTDLKIRVKLRPLIKIRGGVVDQAGKPVAKATVCSGRSLVTADDAGQFALETVIVNGIAGNVVAWSPDKRLAAAMPVKDVSQELLVRLQPLQERQVMATTSDGLPATDLTIEYGGMFARELCGTVKTDAAGQAKATNLVAGAQYQFYWTSDNEKNRDYGMTFANINLADLKADEAIRLQARRYTNAIMGTVVDETGKPVAGAMVHIGYSETLRRQDDSFIRLPIKTDSEGRFEISRMAAGVIHVQIAADGYVPATLGTMTDNADFRPVLRKVGAKPTCVARAVDESGTGLAGQHVCLWATSYRPQGGAKTLLASEGDTDQDGLVRLSLPVREDDMPVRLLLACEPVGRNLALASVLPDEDSEVWLLARRAAGHWRGRVVDESDRPIAGEQVRVVSIEANDGLPHVEFSTIAGEVDDPLGLAVATDAAGRFELSRLGQTGNIYLLAQADDAASQRTWVGERAGTDERTIVIGSKGCSLIGQVVDRVTGKPMRLRNGAGIFMQSVGQGTYESAASRIDGRFGILNMPPGEYDVTANLYFDNPQYVCKSPVRVRLEQGRTAEMTIPMEVGIRVTGSLVQAKTGKPLRGGSIEAKMVNGGKSAQAQFDEEGRWVLHLPDEGDYMLVYYSLSGRAEAKPMKIHAQRGKPMEGVEIEVD